MGTSLPLGRLAIRDSQDLSIYTVYGSSERTSGSTAYAVKAWAIEDSTIESEARCTLAICANNRCGEESNLTSAWTSYSSSFEDDGSSIKVAASWTVRCYGATRSHVGLDDVYVQYDTAPAPASSCAETVTRVIFSTATLTAAVNESVQSQASPVTVTSTTRIEGTQPTITTTATLFQNQTCPGATTVFASQTVTAATPTISAECSAVPSIDNGGFEGASAAGNVTMTPDADTLQAQGCYAREQAVGGYGRGTNGQNEWAR